MEVLNLDAVTSVVLTGLVMGGVELIKRIFSKDWEAVAIILAASIIGGLAGMAMGVNYLAGVAFGLAASGYVTLAQNLGKNSREY